MAANRHELKTYLESTLHPKQKEARDLGVRPLSAAALTKCLSLVQADLLGASISGESVDEGQLEAMLQVPLKPYTLQPAPYTLHPEYDTLDMYIYIYTHTHTRTHTHTHTHTHIYRARTPPRSAASRMNK